MLKSLLNAIMLATVLTWAAHATQVPGVPNHQDQAPSLDANPENEYYCIAGSVGMPGVQMTGLPGGIVSDASGHYQALIKKDAQPMVIPMKEGYEFNPKGKIYNHVCADLVGQNYQCKPARYTISGSVGHADVLLQGFDQPVVTDQYGHFTAEVPHGWQACVTPRKEGLEFTPPQIHYTRVIQDMDRQNFTAHFKTVTLSGAIIIGHCPMPGVTVSTNFGGGADTTDELGRFYIEVPYGWTGDVTPYKKGFSFSPPCLDYRNVKEDIDSIDRETGAVKSPAGSTHCFFDIAHLAASDHVQSTDTTLIPTKSRPAHNATRIRNNLREVAAIMNERLGAFAAQTQGIYIQDYGIILHSQMEPAFTFQGFPRATQPSCPSDHYLSLLKENSLKLIAHTANVKILDPNQWVVVTLAIPSTQGEGHAMTLRARKHDVDAFAANKTNLQEFRRRVQITVQ